MMWFLILLLAGVISGGLIGFAVFFAHVAWVWSLRSPKGKACLSLSILCLLTAVGLCALSSYLCSRI